MKKFILILYMTGHSFLSMGQSEFPKDFVGVWSGELKIYKHSGKISLTLPMELRIDTTSKDSLWQWQISYFLSQKGPDIRSYFLRLKDSTTSDYEIDEKNGIVLHAKLFDNTLVSRFSVQNNLLLIKYSFGKDSIYFETITGKESEKQKTGDIKEEEIPAVYNYLFSGYQNAILRRKE
jgi:hypothetical protein